MSSNEEYVADLQVIKNKCEDYHHVFTAQLVLSVRDFMRSKSKMKKPLEEMSIEEIIVLTRTNNLS